VSDGVGYVERDEDGQCWTEPMTDIDMRKL